MTKKKVLVITGSRAEYGLLKKLMRLIMLDSELILQLVVTGSHLSSRHGLTVREIEEDGFPISARIPIVDDSDSAYSVSNSMGLAIQGFAGAYETLSPDLILVLGDRYEIASAILASVPYAIPVAHLHGGELTFGAFDDALRHAITKLSHLHFVAAEEYRRRVIQLGESPNFVFNVGGLGVDAISEVKLISRAEIEEMLNIKLNGNIFLVTYHPATLELKNNKTDFRNLLEALATITDSTFIFTYPNADPGGVEVIELINSFIGSQRNAFAFDSLGQTLYFSLVAQSTAVLGNSSSGLLEVPTFKVGTINIGNRQEGRLKATSVFDCAPNFESIVNAISTLLSDKGREMISLSKNPYGDPGASVKILEILKNIDLEKVCFKAFNDLT